jgi:transposase
LLQQGYRQAKVSQLLGVSIRSLQRWSEVFATAGQTGLAALDHRASDGRPPKLSKQQDRQVLTWLEHPATDFGFPTDLWTARRLAELIDLRLGVIMNHRYLCAWLKHRGITPQKPRQQARERDQEAIDAWVRWRWPAIKKKASICTPPLVLPMKPATCWLPWFGAASLLKRIRLS